MNTVDVLSLANTSIYYIIPIGNVVFSQEYKENPSKIVLGERMEAAGNYLVRILTNQVSQTKHLEF